MNYQEHLFALVAEECGEVAQAAIKCLRFTPDHAYYADTNLERLQVEITDLITILSLLEDSLKVEFDLKPSKAKVERVLAHLDISTQLGTLT